MKTPITLIAVFAVTVATVLGSDGRGWVIRPPDDKFGIDERARLDRADVFEVVASKLGLAVSSELAKKAIVEISEKAAANLTGAYYRCPKGKKPFLVRAVYSFGGTGHFIVIRHGDSIWVEHQSLGTRPFDYYRAALVVNLDFNPRDAFATSSVIE